MLNKPVCPCCSQPLLRHASFKRVFWFCSHCHQEMPDLLNGKDALLHRQHWLSQTITERRQLKEKFLQAVASLEAIGVTHRS